MDETSQYSQTSDEAPRPSLKKLGGVAVGLLQSHLELLGIEFQEEKSRSFQLFLFAGVALIFGLLLLVGLSAALMIHFWDSHRLLAAIGLCLIYGCGLAFALLRARSLVQRGETPFQTTLEELARTRENLLP